MNDPLQFRPRISLDEIADMVLETDAFKRELDRRLDELTDWCAFAFVLGILLGIAMAYWAAHGVHP